MPPSSHVPMANAFGQSGNVMVKMTVVTTQMKIIAKVRNSQKILGIFFEDSWLTSRADFERIDFFILILFFAIPVDCQWSDWSSCSKTCGLGQVTRTIKTPARNGGEECSGSRTKSCSLGDCQGKHYKQNLLYLCHQ